MSEWIDHDGKGMPVSGDTVVQVRFKGGWTDERNNTFDDASDWYDEQPEASSWVSTEDDDYIVAYRVHSVAPVSEMNEWTSHDGKGMPVDGSTLVYVKFPDGYDDTVSADGEPLEPSEASYWSRGWEWMSSTPLDVEIVAYRVHKPEQAGA